MKILTTVSAVVFLMILTTGLATAKKVPVPTFPFTATGDIFSVSDGGVAGVPFSTDITVYEAGNGLFWGTITFGTTTIEFSAVKDSSGVYTLNGQLNPGTLTVIGKFTITYVKHEGFEAAIQWDYPGIGSSFAGTLSQ